MSSDVAIAIEEKVCLVQEAYVPETSVSLVARGTPSAQADFRVALADSQGALTAARAGEDTVPGGKCFAPQVLVGSLQRCVGARTRLSRLSERSADGDRSSLT